MLPAIVSQLVSSVPDLTRMKKEMMESRMFIRAANELMDEIRTGFEAANRDHLQKEISRIFVGLQNPTLPTALKLRDFALDHGFFVSPRIMQLLHQGETIWSFGI